MPIGVIINALAVFLGGLLGAVIQKFASEDFQNKMNLVFGACSMSIGVASIVLMENLPAVVFSLIAGSAIGLLLHLESGINRAVASLMKSTRNMDEERRSELITVIVLFCASGTGIYGSILSGFTGDHSILLAKAIMDFFTASIFACRLGKVVSLTAIPQFLLFLILFFCATIIFPLTTPGMINDFKACGGIIMLCTGFRIAKIRQFPIADMIPSMIIVFPVSWLWTNWIIPLL